MSLLGKLFGTKTKHPPLSELYGAYTITEHPLNEGGQYRLSCKITKGAQTHHLIRADTFLDAQSAHEVAVHKAKQVIDQQGDGIFA